MFFLQPRATLQLCLLPEVTFIQIFDVFRGGVGGVMDPVLWNKNGIDSGAESSESEPTFQMAMLCWDRNQNQLQFFFCFFLAEPESIPVS